MYCIYWLVHTCYRLPSDAYALRQAMLKFLLEEVMSPALVAYVISKSYPIMPDIPRLVELFIQRTQRPHFQQQVATIAPWALQTIG